MVYDTAIGEKLKMICWRRLTLGIVCAFLMGCLHRQADEPNTLYVALAASPATLDPRYATDATGMRIDSLLFESLVRLGPDLKIVGEAATSWTYKNLIYTFQLRPDMEFSDGTPVTRDDLDFSVAQFRQPNSPFAATLQAVDHVVVRYDEHARFVQFYLKEFSAALLSDLPAIKIIPKQIVLAKGDDFARAPIGSGPYKFVSQSANEICLQARTKHVRQTPRTENLIFKIVRDDSTRFYKTLKGEIDIAQAELPSNKIAAFAHNPKYQVFKTDGLATTYLLINLRDPVLKSKAIRQALARAINRDEIIRYKLDGLAVPATSILTPSNPFFDARVQNLPFDVELARQQIKNLGLVGHQFTIKSSNLQVVIENARVLAHQLEAAGLRVSLQSYEWGTFYEDLKKGNFQLAMARWVGVTEPDFYRVAFDSHEVPPGRNRGYYSNPTFDHLVERAKSEESLDQRLKLYKQAQRILLEDLPIIPLWYDTQVAVVNSRVKNYGLSRSGDFSGLLDVSKEPPK
jgi:peptide/nickel transport system substrate-binding protein